MRKMSKEEYELLQRLIIDRGVLRVNKIAKEVLLPFLEERTLNFFKNISLIRVPSSLYWYRYFRNLELSYDNSLSANKYFVFNFIEISKQKNVSSLKVKFDVINTETFLNFSCDFMYYRMFTEDVILSCLHTQKSFDEQIKDSFTKQQISFVKD